MVKLLLIIFSLSSFPLIAQEFQWVEMGGATAISNTSYVADTKTDNQGNLYVCGAFSGSLNLGNNFLYSNGGRSDIFIAKHTQNGNCIWAKQFGGGGVDNLTRLYINASGEVYFTGLITGPPSGIMNFGSISVNLTPGKWAICFGKIDTNGNIIWVKTNTTVQNTGIAYGYDLALDTNQNIYITGSFAGTLAFDSVNYLYVPITQQEGFVAKFNANGTALWVKKPDTTFISIWGKEIEVGLNGNIYLTADPKDNSLPNSNSSRLFCMNSQGSALWNMSFSTDSVNSFASPYSMILDQYDNIICSGAFRGSMTISNKTINTNLTTLNSFITKLSPNGNCIWLRKSVISKNLNASNNVEVQPDGEILETGSFSDTVHIGNLVFQNLGRDDAYFIQRDSSGQVVRAFTFGGSNDDYSSGFNKNSNGSYVISGNAFGNVTFGTQVHTFSSVTQGGIGGAKGSLFMGEVNLPPTSIEEIFTRHSLPAHPNPTASSLTFTFPTLPTSAHLTFTDALGRTVLQQTLPQGSTQYTTNLSNLPEAVYFFQLITEKGPIGSGKVSVIK